MGEVHDLHHAEDQREPRGDEREDESREEPGDERLRDELAGHLPHAGKGQRICAAARSNG